MEHKRQTGNTVARRQQINRLGWRGNISEPVYDNTHNKIANS